MDDSGPTASKEAHERHDRLIATARRQTEHVRVPASARSGLLRDRLGDQAHALAGYEIGRAMHRGGQGIVYQAVQSSTGRRVAIKFMRDALVAGPRDRARFEREVHILGQLDHPNIVRIIDSGEVDGRQFFVMDYIDGVPVTDSGKGSLHDQLLLFATICDAVHAAHLHGVIHRDLKPGNILVDSAGRPHVLDFGMAKLLPLDGSTSSMTAMTETGQFLGSLPWASPEQVSSDGAGIDLRSDVYSLGVILYQMLTGTFPYRVSGSIREVTDNILGVDAARPSVTSRRGHRIDGEVETIVLKALQKKPERRYQSAGDLARDIRHYLRGELIEAKRDSLSYVVRKQLQRHWLAVGVVVAFVVLIAVSLLVSVGLWQTAADERDHMERQRTKAESVNRFLNNMLASANPDIVQGREVTVRHTLDEASRQVESGQLGNQLDVEAAVRLTLGRTYAALGEYGPAHMHLDRARAIRSQLLGEDHPDYAQVLLALASVAHAERDLAESIRLAERAQAVYEHAYEGRDHADVALTLANLAEYVSSDGDGQRAIAIKRQSLEMLQRLHGDEHEEVIRSKARLAAMLHDPIQAEPLLRDALELSLRTLGEKHPQVAKLCRQLGGTLVMGRKIDEALAMYTRAVALHREVVGEHTRETLHCQMDLAFAYRMAGDLQAEVEAINVGIVTAREIYGEPSFGLAEILVDRGDALSRSGEGQSAVSDHRKALSMLQAVGRDHEPLGAVTRLHIARHALDAGDLAESERLAREVLAFLPDQTSVEQGLRAYARGILGAVLAARGGGEFEAAEDLLLGAYEALATNPGGALLRKHKRSIAQWLTQLYETWDAADPGAEKGALAEQWRAKSAQERQGSGKPY